MKVHVDVRLVKIKPFINTILICFKSLQRLTGAKVPFCVVWLVKLLSISSVWFPYF